MRTTHLQTAVAVVTITSTARAEMMSKSLVNVTQWFAVKQRKCLWSEKTVVNTGLLIK